jgi:hypothetical protein
MLVAPAEVHPIYNVTGVEWMAENMPDLKTAVICAQDDALGLPSVATYLAAFEAAGIEMIEEPLLFDPATTDFAPVVTKLLSKNPQIVCLDTAYSDYVHPIIVEEIARIIEEINAQGMTVVLVEQNAELALDLANYAYVLETGGMETARRARSSLFHLRMEALHWDTYQDNMRTRMRAFAAETAEALAAFERGEASPHRLYERWLGEKPNVFDDTRKFLAAALLVGVGGKIPPEFKD